MVTAAPQLLPLLYLASPALPVGAFAWSQGLAGAAGQGWLGRVEPERLAAWLAGVLEYGLGRFDLPLLARCFEAARGRDSQALAHWNDLSLAGRGTAELWQEESRLGQSLRALLTGQNLWPAWAARLTCPGYVAAYALGAVALLERAGQVTEAARLETAVSFAWSWLVNQTVAAAKLLPLGQTVLNRILLDLMPLTLRVGACALELPEAEIGSSLPGLALASLAHEGQSARMFRS
jgi:urease accessory protein